METNNIDIKQFPNTYSLDAAECQQKLKFALKDIGVSEESLAHNYVRLGELLIQVRNKKYWMLWGFETFVKYLNSVKLEINYSRSQLYAIMNVQERLIAAGVSERELTQMGITKATELSRYVKQTGRSPSRKLLDIAINPEIKVNRLREEIFNETHITSVAPGKYFDLGGFYCTAEERKEIVRAFDLAEKVDPVIIKETPEWARKKEIMLRLAREFIGTWETEVGGNGR